MIKSNGGVFGRNPTFNDVTVDGNLTTTGALQVAGGVGVGGALHTGDKVTAEVTSATTNAPIPVAQVNAQCSGTPAAGFGSAIEFAAETSVGNTEIGARIDAVAVDTTAGSEDFDLVFRTMAGGSAPVERLRIGTSNTSGQVPFLFSADNANNRSIEFESPNQTIRMSLNDGSLGYPSLGTFSNHSFELKTGWVNRVTIGTNGNVLIRNGNLVMGTAGTGIDFSADGNAAGMTSELLDDYEEGTWTPAYGTVTNPFTTMTMDIVSAQYTKVGRLVTVTAYIRTDNVDATGASGGMTITGLPFTAAATNGWAGLDVGYAIDFGTAPVAGYVVANTTTVRLVKYASNNNMTNLAVADMTAGATANQNELVFSCTYIAA